MALESTGFVYYKANVPNGVGIFQWEDKNRIEIRLGNKLMFPTNPIYLGLGI